MPQKRVMPGAHLEQDEFGNTPIMNALKRRHTYLTLQNLLEYDHAKEF